MLTLIPVIHPEEGVTVNVRLPSIYEPLFYELTVVEIVGKL